MKSLVTGANGFIGTYVCQELKQRGAEVIRFDRQGESEFYGDIKDDEAVNEAVSNSDVVIHLAGLLGTQEGMFRAQDYVDVNITGSLNVFNAMTAFKKRGAFISVGNYWMNNPYSISKNTAERFALMYNKELGSNIAVVRGLNAYGPGQKSYPIRKVVPSFIERALANEPIEIYGDGEQIMDMIYVQDLARILVNAATASFYPYHKVLEAGMGEDTTVNMLAETIVDITDSESEIVHLPMRPGEEPNSVVKANTGLLQTLDWMPEVELAEGLKFTAEWYRVRHNAH